MRPPLLLAAVVAAGALAGCGSTAPDPTPPGALVRGPAGYYSEAKLERSLSNAFRSGLYRLAVMSQPGEGAIDLGQQLPTGKLTAVSCAPKASAPARGRDWPWSCDVRWRTVSGAPATTRYGVVLTPHSCFSADALPHYDSLLDATTGAPAEHPLNTFGRGLGTC